MLVGCRSNQDEDLFQYQGTLVGDNSAVGHIINELPHSNLLNEFSLETEVEPYGIQLEYDQTEDSFTENEMQELVLYNSSFLLGLVHNAEWITFDFGEIQHTITRVELEEWHGKSFTEIESGNELKELVTKNTEDQAKVDQLFVNVTKLEIPNQSYSHLHIQGVDQGGVAADTTKKAIQSPDKINAFIEKVDGLEVTKPHKEDILRKLKQLNVSGNYMITLSDDEKMVGKMYTISMFSDGTFMFQDPLIRKIRFVSKEKHPDLLKEVKSLFGITF